MNKDIEYGMEWVFDLPVHLWTTAVSKVIAIEEMVQAQTIVTIHGLGSILEMYQSGNQPRDPILVIKTGEGFVIRDGHHRFVRAMLQGIEFLEAKVIEDPR